MTMDEKNLIKKYMPILMVDKREPFEIKALGCTIFREDLRSDSFPKRFIHADWEETDFVIEYAIWFDYDIQHLYELEHVWVYVAKDGSISHLEGSFHGKYLNCLEIDTGKVPMHASGHPMCFLQPGKHAVLPDARLVKLVPEWKESCMEGAGANGVPVPEEFRGNLRKLSAGEEAHVCAYIHEKYAFTPSEEYAEAKMEDVELLSWEELKASIPERLRAELRKMGIEA